MGGKETPFGVVFAHSVFSFGFLEKLLELFLLVLPFFLCTSDTYERNIEQ
jgi:hypothetical protein